MTRLLLVEDDLLTADFAMQTLRRAKPDWSVTQVATLSDAIGSVQEGVCAVLLDLELPDADGVEAVIALRAVIDLPIVVVSGRGEHFAAAMGAGADAAFGKLEFDLPNALSFLEGRLGAS